MRSECIEEVQKAIGRRITKAEARNIEDRVDGALTRLARSDIEAYKQMPEAERYRKAADMAAQDLIGEANLKERRMALQLEALERHLPAVEKAGKKSFKVIQRKLMQVDVKIKGLTKEYMSMINEAVDLATKTPVGSLRWLTMAEDPAKTMDFVREVFGKDSGNPEAKGAAKAWLKGIEDMRVRFNNAGGDVRKLMYGYLPQPHDANSIRAAGARQWISDVLPMVDRSRYLTPEGRPMGDVELGKVLEAAYDNLSTDGLASIEPGQFRGQGSLANAGSQARVIHFATPEAYVNYLGKYGAGTVWGALQGHVGWMAKNIGMVEELGPNPNTTYRTLHDTAAKSMANDRVAFWMTTDDMWKTLTGELSNPLIQSKHRFHQAIRNIEVFGKLQKAAISSVTDIPLYLNTLGYNRLPIFEGMVNLVRSFGSDYKHFAEVAGLIADSKIGDMRMYAEGNFGDNWTSRVANATMKVSLLNAWTDGVRRAFSVTMMAGMARIAKTPWEALDSMDRARLETSGWTPQEWSVLQKATPEEWKGKQMLTPESIMSIEGLDHNAKQRAVSRLLGTLVDESEYGSPASNLVSRTIQAGGTRAGTTTGELYRHVMLFKGYPFAMIFRHFDRAINGDMTPAGKIAYSANMLIAPALFGALALHLKDLIDGKDPRPMDSAKFWSAAVAQGGGLSFIGDLLLNGQGAQGQSQGSAAIGSIAGPVAGAASELFFDLGAENIRQAMNGEDTHAGAEAFRWLRSHTPFVNLWYAKLVLDRAALDEFQEFLSPGYTDRMRRKSERDWGTTWWWERTGEGMQGPDRAPDLSTAVGQQ